MRKLLLNWRFLVGTALCAAVGGIYFSFAQSDFMWFARSGAIVVAMGLILLAHSSILGEDVSHEVFDGETGLSTLDSELYQQQNEQVPDWVWRHRRARYAIGVLGPIVSGIGTLIWGFGDLLNIVFEFKP